MQVGAVCYAGEEECRKCHAGCQSFAILSPSTSVAVQQALLAQRDAITNWPAFSQANGIVGWSESEPDVCEWTGVNCTADGTVYRL